MKHLFFCLFFLLTSFFVEGSDCLKTPKAQPEKEITRGTKRKLLPPDLKEDDQSTDELQGSDEQDATCEQASPVKKVRFSIDAIPELEDFFSTIRQGKVTALARSLLLKPPSSWKKGHFRRYSLASLHEKTDLSCVHIAMTRDDYEEALKVLLSHQVDIDAASPLGPTALAWMVQRGDVDRVKCLLKHGANPDGLIGLHYATIPPGMSFQGTLAEIQARMKPVLKRRMSSEERKRMWNEKGYRTSFKGPEISVDDCSKIFPLAIARRAKNQEIKNVLLDAGATPSF